MLKVSKKMLPYVVSKKPRLSYENLKVLPFAKLLLKSQVEVLSYMLGRLLELSEDDEGITEKELNDFVFRLGHYIYYVVSRRNTKDVYMSNRLQRGRDLFSNSRVWGLWFPSSREQRTDTFARFQEFIHCTNNLYHTFTRERGTESISQDLATQKHNFSYMITYLMDSFQILVAHKYGDYDAELLPKPEKKAKEKTVTVDPDRPIRTRRRAQNPMMRAAPIPVPVDFMDMNGEPRAFAPYYTYGDIGMMEERQMEDEVMERDMDGRFTFDEPREIPTMADFLTTMLNRRDIEEAAMDVEDHDPMEDEE